MTPTWQPAAHALVLDLRSVFGDRLQSVVAYGPHVEGDPSAPLTCLAMVDSLAAGDLEACARHVGRWQRGGIATPLVLPASEFHRSLDAFPLEYGEIIRTHVRVLGPDPFEGVSIAPGDLRRACETQIKSHLVHLREGFLEARGRPAGVAALVTASAGAFAALLRHIAWLSGATAADRADAAVAGARAAGLADGIVSDMLTVAAGSDVPTADPARLFPQYLEAVEQLAHAIDTWRG
jgi:hypothetical protein